MGKTLRVMQMAYLNAMGSQESTSETCSLCWNTGCDCGGYDVKSDPFINLTAEEFHTI
jgi:hypothetical protein